ncbi:MAG: HEAT repeat domain-containing protein [Treponema sp.]|nr:HEAT repeat domain-containing protein [Treponema sp.]MDE6245813.1 HEAT repeat domain-containing protein [Treponemataceae bacterium]MBD5410792.1 HEAT repeat domain-containing protein [Treponema sp.]MBD5412151.1 HEAT repeat domain-containing protein [Treponema sp.]MBD5413637.1 HEAT repeat domain-containing protein [Treponema sp.]
MKIFQKLFVAFGFIALASTLFAQETQVENQKEQSKSESSVEDEYLSDVDGLVILSMVSADDYETKLEAMQMLELAVDNGNTSPDIMNALNQLAGAGITTQSRMNGRLTNNFPDLRRRACLTLGKIKTEESKDFLKEIVLAENEPMVITAAVNSLGEVGINTNDDVINTISFANRRNQILNPTSSLASEVIDCYEKLADSTENKRVIIDSLTQIASDYHYNRTVRAKAYKLLKKLSESGSSSKEEK